MAYIFNSSEANENRGLKRVSEENLEVGFEVNSNNFLHVLPTHT
jgi:hypothetical protein